MDDIDLVKLEALVATMRRLGVLKCGSVVLGPLPTQDPGPGAAAELDLLTDDALPPDDALFWSVAGPLPSEVSDSSRPPEE
jgi:hypothetical protein